MKDPKTTILGVITGVVAILGAVAAYLKTGSIDAQGALTGVLGILAAFGLYAAADSK